MILDFHERQRQRQNALPLCKYIENIIPNTERASYRIKTPWYYFAILNQMRTKSQF